MISSVYGMLTSTAPMTKQSASESSIELCVHVALSPCDLLSSAEPPNSRVQPLSVRALIQIGELLNCDSHHCSSVVVGAPSRVFASVGSPCSPIFSV